MFLSLKGITDVEMEPSKYRRLPGGGVLVLGQDQDSPGARFDPGQSVSAKLTQFGMWKEVLTPAEIRYHDFREIFSIVSRNYVGTSHICKVSYNSGVLQWYIT